MAVSCYYILTSFIVSLLLGLTLIPFVIRFCKNKGLYDMPDMRKVHRVVVPRLGGACFLPCMVVSFMLAVALFGNTSYGMGFNISLWACYFAVGLLCIYAVGVVDDVVGVSPRTKFIVQIFAASVLPASGLYINNLYGLCGFGNIPFGLGAPLTVFVIVFIDNAINLIDGIDGLASGVSIVALVGFLFIFAGERLLPYSILVSGLIGVLVAFVRYNLFGKTGVDKIFMGDTGSLTIGFILGVLFVKCSMVREDAAPQVLGGMPKAYSLLVVPVFDVCRVIAVRFVHHRPLFAPDKNHIHHKMLRAGMTQRQALCVIVSIAIVLITVNMMLDSYFGFTVIVFLDVLLWLMVHHLLNKSIKNHGQKVCI